MILTSYIICTSIFKLL